jgi:hypothetical protein
MSNDFGLVNPVGLPFLERISREEQLSDELPRKARNLKTEKAKKKSDDEKPDGSLANENSITSHHIDLRI